MYCTTCWTEFNSEIPAKIHYESNTHMECVKFQQELNENRPKSNFYCTLCSLYTNSAYSLAMHMGSKTHKSKLASKENIQNLIKGSRQDFIKKSLSFQGTNFDAYNNISPSNSFEMTTKLKNYCEICMVQLDSATAYAIHLGSANHKSKIISQQNGYANYVFSPATPIKNIAISIKNHAGYEMKKNFSFNDASNVRAEFFCDICLIVFNSQASQNEHFQSEKHRKKLEVCELIKKLNGCFGNTN